MTIHYRDKFVDWLEGRLPAEERAQLQNHLARCEACRQYFSGMESYLKKPEGSRLLSLEVDPYARTRIVALAESESRKSGFYQRWFRPGFAALVFTLMTLFAVYGGFRLGKAWGRPQPSDELYAFAVQQQSYMEISDTGFAQVWQDLEGELNNEN